MTCPDEKQLEEYYGILTEGNPHYIRQDFTLEKFKEFCSSNPNFFEVDTPHEIYESFREMMYEEKWLEQLRKEEEEVNKLMPIYFELKHKWCNEEMTTKQVVEEYYNRTGITLADVNDEDAMWYLKMDLGK